MIAPGATRKDMPSNKGIFLRSLEAPFADACNSQIWGPIAYVSANKHVFGLVMNPEGSLKSIVSEVTRLALAVEKVRLQHTRKF